MSTGIRILLSTSSYPTDSRDWRSRFIADMLCALAQSGGLHVKFWGPPGEMPASVGAVTTERESAWLRELMENGGLAHLLRQSMWQGGTAALRYLSMLRNALKRNKRVVDIAHVNWLQNAVALWGTRIPAVITVLGSDFGLLRYRPIRLLLRAALREQRAVLAPNAGWMMPRLHQLFGDLVEIAPVPFGVEASWFSLPQSPRDDRKQRWIVISRLTKTKLGPLFEWGDRLFGAERELHILGPNVDSLTIPLWVTYHGPTFPDEIKTRWFPSATGLITLSEHDEGRPQVLLEAMAAGLPVVASANPAHCDVIQHRETGFLVDSHGSLQEALEFFADPAIAARIGSNAREWVRQHLGTWDDTAMRYAKLYGKLMAVA